MMTKQLLNCCALLMLAATSGPVSADLVTFAQNFEGLTPNENVIPNTLSANGWLVGANVFQADGTTFIYNYFAFPAPNGGNAFSAVVTGQGGVAQGNNQLSVYNDYNNADHTANGGNRRIEANVFRDIGIIGAADVGKTFQFTFDAKQGNIAAPTTATAFLKVLDQPSFAQTTISSFNSTSIGTNWISGTLSVTIDASWVGDLVQIGFTNTASGSAASGVFYDNVRFAAVPEPGGLSLLALGMVSAAYRRRRSCS